MWKPEYIKIKRLGPHIDSEYSFQGVAKLIQGLNKDDEGQESNGAGKSILAEAIAIVLAGTTFRGIRIVELINDDYEDCEIEFKLNNKYLDKSVKITRLFTRKGVQKISVILNPDGQSPKREDIKKAGVGEYDAYILELIGISKEDLFNYFIIHKDTFIPFFIANDEKKKETIARFSGASLLKGIEWDIKLDIGVFVKHISNFETEKSRAEGKLEVYKNSLEKVKDEDLEKIKKETIQSINNLIQGHENNITELYLDESELKVTLEVVQNIILINNNRIGGLVNPTCIKGAELAQELKEGKDLKALIQEVQTEQDFKKLGLMERKREYLVKLADIIECPKCHYKFSFQDKDLNIEEVKTKSNQTDVDIDEVTQLIISKKEELSELDLAIKEIEAEIHKLDIKSGKFKMLLIYLTNHIKYFESKKKGISDQLVQIPKDIKEQEDAIEKNKKEIDRIKKEGVKSQKEELERSIKFEEETISGFTKKIIETQQKKNEKEEWIDLFKRFDSYLANEVLKSIEGFTNFYLNKFHSNLNVLIEGYKLLADGKTLREEIDTFIIKNGSVRGKYRRFSNGERTRVFLANIVAIQKLINLSSPTGGLDLLLLDEIMESLDTKGLINIMNCLKELEQTIEVVTLNTSENIYPFTSIVVKENGISKFI